MDEDGETYFYCSGSRFKVREHFADTGKPGGALTDAELDYLPWGAKLMTLECGIRFLTDYLEGDHYFHIQRPRQNLDRARTQFKLVQDMEENWDAMRTIVDKYRA